MWKRAETYLEMGDTQRALADYGAVIERNPGAAAYYYRSAAYARMGDYQLALADLDKAIKIEPAFAEAYLRRGEIHLRLNQPNEAESDHHKVVQYSTDEISGVGRRSSDVGSDLFPQGIRISTTGTLRGGTRRLRKSHRASAGVRDCPESGRRIEYRSG